MSLEFVFVGVFRQRQFIVRDELRRLQWDILVIECLGDIQRRCLCCQCFTCVKSIVKDSLLFKKHFKYVNKGLYVIYQSHWLHKYQIKPFKVV